MEEVWKDINMSSLNEQNTRRPMIMSTRDSSTFGGVILQDFLARPKSIDHHYSSNNSSSSVPSDQNPSFYCPTVSTAPPPLVTALSLNSRPDHFPFDPLIRQTNDNNSHSLVQQQHQHHHRQQRNITAPKVSHVVNPSPFDPNVGVVSNAFTCFGKRFGEPDVSPGERRNKRMIKNRESAARSRARKQAYTNELELKVDLLMEENAKLRRQQQELWEAASNAPKKNSLQRTLTAPF
ncbi:protein FD-like [Vicia villosa]|uniref:protein FD-like n=1 Tax=Vicia villosa TaxID=3911 RepID=UPI00273AA582|nr:protein FD-like [Vicia villosa]